MANKDTFLVIIIMKFRKNIFRVNKSAVFVLIFVIISRNLFNILMGLTTHSLVGLQLFGVIVFLWQSNTQRCHQVAHFVH